MKIGFIKFGLKTYFKKNGTGQGSNHELVDVFNIFAERGHICYMLSNNDTDPAWQENEGIEFDYIFVFNGNTPNTWQTNMNMLRGSLKSMELLYANKEIPWVYFWTDPRYDLRKNRLFEDFPPSLILSQEPEHYGHLDKLILYKKEIPKSFNKDIEFSILMNDTKEKVRKKGVLDVLNWLRQEGYDHEVRGQWRGDIIANPLDEENVMPHLARVNFSYNCGKDKNWVSQKYWEMALNSVICFYQHYDEGNLLMLPNDTRRVKDGIDVINKLKKFKEIPMLEPAILYLNGSEILSEYLDGSFIYNFIIEKLK